MKKLLRLLPFTSIFFSLHSKHFIEEFFKNDPFFQEVASTMKWSSPVPLKDYKETDDKVVIEIDLPNVKKENITIELSDNAVLTVSAHQSEHKEEKAENTFQRCEIVGTMQRSVTLPSSLDSDTIEAQLEKGKLSITIMKKKKSEELRRRVIPIA